MLSLIQSVLKTLVPVTQFSNGAIALTIILKTSIEVPLTLITVSELAAGTISSTILLLGILRTNNNKTLQLIQIPSLILDLTSISTMIYWIDNILMSNSWEKSSMIKHLKICLVTTFIVSCFIRSMNYIEFWSSRNYRHAGSNNAEKSQAGKIQSDLESIQPNLKHYNMMMSSKEYNYDNNNLYPNFESELLTSSTKVTSKRSNSVKVKNSAQTLVESLSENIDFKENLDDSHYQQDIIANRCEIIPEFDTDFDYKQKQIASSLPQLGQAQLNLLQLTKTDTHFTNNSSGVQYYPQPQYYEHLNYSVGSNSSIQIPEPFELKRTTLNHSPQMSFNVPDAIAEEDSYENNSHDGLGDLSQIPQHSNRQWPLTKPTNFTANSNNNNSSKGLNYISLDSWKKNSNVWLMEKERIGNFPSLFNTEHGNPQSPPLEVPHLKKRPFLTRSISEPSSTNSIGSNSNNINYQDPNKNGLYYENNQSKINLDILQSQYEYPSKNASTNTNLEDDHYRSIMNESFMSSYETLSRMNLSPSLEETTESLTVSHNNTNHSYNHNHYHHRFNSLNNFDFRTIENNLSKLDTTSHSRSGSMQNPPSPSSTLRDVNATVIGSRLGSGTRSRSASSSPLKRLRSLKFKKNSVEQLNHSQSEPELNFEYIKQLQSSPKHNHHHKKTSSSICLKTPIKSSIDNTAGNGLLVENEDDEEKTTPESNKSASSSVPSVVIGEYDKEKWRTIKKKLIDESVYE